LKANILPITGYHINGRTHAAINRNFTVKSSSISTGDENWQKAAKLLCVIYATIQAEY
jgi:hypothetical protein